MTQTADFFDRRDSYRGAFLAATALHVAIVLVVALPAWLAGKTNPVGDTNAGGGIGNGGGGKIARLHQGPKKLVATDSTSQITKHEAQHAKNEPPGQYGQTDARACVH